MIEHVRIIKEAVSPSLSGKSTLTYQVGRDDQVIFIRIRANSNNGYFNGHWVALTDILTTLQECTDKITFWSLAPLFPSMSINTPAFILAALKHEGLVIPLGGKERGYKLAEDCQAKVDALKTADPKPTPKRKGGRPLTRKPMPDAVVPLNTAEKGDNAAEIEMP